MIIIIIKSYSHPVLRKRVVGNLFEVPTDEDSGEIRAAPLLKRMIGFQKRVNADPKQKKVRLILL